MPEKELEAAVPNWWQPCTDCVTLFQILAELLIGKYFQWSGVDPGTVQTGQPIQSILFLWRYSTFRFCWTQRLNICQLYLSFISLNLYQYSIFSTIDPLHPQWVIIATSGWSNKHVSMQCNHLRPVKQLRDYICFWNYALGYKGNTYHLIFTTHRSSSMKFRLYLSRTWINGRSVLLTPTVPLVRYC